MVGIYLIYSIKDHNKCYVGSSINIERRLYTHYHKLKNNKHSNMKLQRYVNKYGMESISHCILSTFKDITIDELRKIELEDIINLNALNGFNISSITKGATLSEEGRLSISKKAKERQSSEEYKNKLALQYRGTKSVTSKLTKEDIYFIRTNAVKVIKRYRNIAELADKFKVNRKTIYRVLHNQTYKND